METRILHTKLSMQVLVRAKARHLSEHQDCPSKYFSMPLGLGKDPSKFVYLTSFFLSDGGEEPLKPLTDLTIAPLHPRDKGTSNAVGRVPGVGTSLDSNFSTMMSTSAVTRSARGAGGGFSGWRLRSRQIEGKGTS